MIKNLVDLLKILDGTLSSGKQDNIESRHHKALNWKKVERLPLVITFPYPESEPFRPYPHREVFNNPEKMLFNELVHAFDTSIFLNSEINDDLPYTIRANFGTVIIASIFGGKTEQRGDNPPWIRHFETLEEFKSVFEIDPLDFSQGICPQVISRYQFYTDVLASYPNLQKCVKIVLPDLQGPLDSLELLRGSEIYTDFIMNPEMIDKGLKIMAEAQVGLAKYLEKFITKNTDGFSHQHATAIKGNILIRNDSAIMISPEMYASQVAQHDEFVMKEMGGGGVHSCGKFDFNIPEILKLPSIRCLDFGESHLNDIDNSYSEAGRRKIPLIRIRTSKDDLISGKIKKRFPTGVSLVFSADSFEEAKNISKLYYSN